MTDQNINWTRFSTGEVIVVGIVMGLIIAMAVPRFLRSGEKSAKAEGRMILQQIYRCERLYFREHDQFVAAGNTAVLASRLLHFEDPGPDALYMYSVKARGRFFTAVAVEIGDADGDGVAGEILTIDQDCVEGGDL